MMIFDDERMPNWFEVNNVDLEGLPPLNPTLTKLNGKIGNTFHQQEVGSRNIYVDYTITGTDYSDAMIKYRELMKLLYSKETKKIEFRTEKRFYYKVILSGDTRVRVYRNTIKGTLTFLVPEGYANSKIKKIHDVNKDIMNEGIFDTPPRLVLEVLKETPSITIVSNTGILSLGNADVGTGNEVKPFNPRPIRFHDKMETTTGWVNATGIEGKTTGTLKSNGWSIQIDQLGPDDAGWHGGSGVKTFSESQDFLMTARLVNHKVERKQMGRIQIYLQSSTGKNIAMVELRNSDPNMIKPMWRCRVGENRTVHDTYGPYKGTWADFKDGELHIERVDNKIRFFIGIRREDGTMHTRSSYTYTDVNRNLLDKVSRISFTLQAHAKSPLSTLALSDLKVYEYMEKPDDTPEIENKYIYFQPGDLVVIDSQTTEVSLNGQPAYDLLDPSSVFPFLEKGNNQMVVVEHPSVDGTVEFRERW